MSTRGRPKSSITGLGPLESKVMELLWERGEATVGWVAGRLAGKKRPAYTTIMTVMSRLADKGLLDRTKTGKAYVYRPAITKQEYLSATSRRGVQALVREFGDLALAHFAEEIDRVDPERLEKLRKLLREGSEGRQ